MIYINVVKSKMGTKTLTIFFVFLVAFTSAFSCKTITYDQVNYRMLISKDFSYRAQMMEISPYIHGDGTLDIFISFKGIAQICLPEIFRSFPSYVEGIFISYRNDTLFYDPGLGGVLHYNESLKIEIYFPEKYEADVKHYADSLVAFFNEVFSFKVVKEETVTLPMARENLVYTGYVGDVKKCSFFFLNLTNYIFLQDDEKSTIYKMLVQHETPYLFVWFEACSYNESRLDILKRYPKFYDWNKTVHSFSLNKLLEIDDGLDGSYLETPISVKEVILDVTIFAKDVTILNSTIPFSEKHSLTGRYAVLSKLVSKVNINEGNYSNLPCFNFSAFFGLYPEVSFFKKASVPAFPGRKFTIFIYALNIGYGGAYNVSINDTLPSDFKLVKGNLSVFLPEIKSAPYDLSREYVLVASYDVVCDKEGEYALPNATVTFYDIYSNKYNSVVVSSGNAIIFEESEEPREPEPWWASLLPYIVFFVFLVFLDLYVSYRRKKEKRRKR